MIRVSLTRVSAPMLLRSGDFWGGRVKRQQDCELASLAYDAMDFDAAVMFFSDTPRKR